MTLNEYVNSIKDKRIAVIGVGWYHGFTNEYGRDIFRFRDCLRDALDPKAVRQ